eukprot:5126006-Prymnesium_polylepis.1
MRCANRLPGGVVNRDHAPPERPTRLGMARLLAPARCPFSMAEVNMSAARCRSQPPARSRVSPSGRSVGLCAALQTNRGDSFVFNCFAPLSEVAIASARHRRMSPHATRSVRGGMLI